MVDIKTKYWERLIELKKDLGWFGCSVLVALTGFCGWFYVTELIRYLENQFDFARWLEYNIGIGRNEMLSNHCKTRLSERLTPEEILAVERNVLFAIEKHGGESLGVIAYRLREQRGRAWGNQSNGSVVVCIVRKGRVVTTYLRRSSQPINTGVTRTDKVVECSKKQEIGKWDQTNTQQHDEAKQ